MGAERPDAARLVARMDARWDAAELERALGRVHREARDRRVRRVVSLAAVSLAAAAVLSVVVTSAGGMGERRASGRAVIELADGSRIEQSEDGAAIVEEVSETHVRVRAARGSLRCDVTPRAERRFEVHAGDVTVTVLGTAFTVEVLADARARVAVERGRVRVNWPGASIELGAGEHGTFPPDEMHAPPVTVADDAALPIAGGDTEREPAGDALEPSEESEPAGGEAAPAERPTARPTEREGDWRLLAHAERYDDAFTSLRDETSIDRVEDLLLAADVARLSGHAAAALPYLDRVLRDHPDDARAPVASFTRGRLLAQLGRHHEAAIELTRAHQMEPDGSLAEDALGRAALEHQAAGEDAPARATASRYLAAHPEGRWAARLRPLLEATSH
jgi:transmembrane sensor